MLHAYEKWPQIQPVYIPVLIDELFIVNCLRPCRHCNAMHAVYRYTYHAYLQINILHAVHLQVPALCYHVQKNSECCMGSWAGQCDIPIFTVPQNVNKFIFKWHACHLKRVIWKQTMDQRCPIWLPQICILCRLHFSIAGIAPVVWHYLLASFSQ